MGAVDGESYSERSMRGQGIRLAIWALAIVPFQSFPRFASIRHTDLDHLLGL